MPIQESGSVSGCKPKTEESKARPKNSMTKHEALRLLRQREIFAYHHLCEVFRAQGHLTPEKLKLLKEVASALYIPDVRHRAECCLALGNGELNTIADIVAGPGSDVEWRKESVELFQVVRSPRVNSANLKLADAVAASVQEQLQQMADLDEDTVVEKTITLKSSLFEKDFVEPEKRKKRVKNKFSCKPEKGIAEDDPKDDDKDGNSSSSVSSASASDDSQPMEKEERKPEVQKPDASKEETDASLMPPPPPVIIIPSPPQPSLPHPSSPHASLPRPSSPHPSPPRASLPRPSSPHPSPTTSPLSPTHQVITVPPPSDMTIVAVPTTETMEIPEITETPIADTPVLSEEEAQARADFFSSLPPLVVVPPPDPSETSAFPSPSPQSPTLVLSPGMSIQIRDDGKKRKRSVSQSQDCASAMSAAKTVALSSYSKMTPVMVTAAAGSSQPPQVKVTPMISRAKMATTSQTQKVIIVSNAPTSNTPILQRSLNVPMGSLGLPMIRANQPRFQPVTAQNVGVGVIRPKMVTVPAKCRAKGSSMINLQLKNAITLKDNVTVVDTNVKRLPGPAKILPKPSGSMYIVNTGHGTHKLATTMSCVREGGKQNVVIVQKGGNQRTLTLSNANKDLMQKLMSKKCVVIQSSKVMPKTISPKPPPTPPQPQSSPVISTAGNTVVLDLSQEQYRQNLGGTMVRDILQAAGIITQPATTLSETAQVSSGEGEWLPVATSKSLSLEEVSLPIGQSESFVTLDEAVEMLEDKHTEGITVSEDGGFTPVSSEQVFTITSDQLSSGHLTVLANKSEPMTNQIVIEALPSEMASDIDCMSQSFLPHKDGAVTIQHSNIDVPANMSLEDYSSQQMENQTFN